MIYFCCRVYAINNFVAEQNSDSSGNPDNAIGASAASAQTGDVLLWAIINACVVIVFIAGMTFLLVLLFKYRCYKVTLCSKCFTPSFYPTTTTFRATVSNSISPPNAGIVRTLYLYHLHRVVDDQWHALIPNIDVVGSAGRCRDVGIRFDQFQHCRDHRYSLWQGMMVRL